jgi:hypothetical protein
MAVLKFKISIICFTTLIQLPMRPWWSLKSNLFFCPKKHLLGHISSFYFFIWNVFRQNAECNNLFETENILLTTLFGFNKFNHFWIS